MPTTIDSLQIEINSDVSSAANGLDKLSKALQRLSNIAGKDFGFNNITKQLKEFNDAISGDLENIEKLGAALANISKVGTIPKKTINSIRELTSALNGIPTETKTIPQVGTPKANTSNAEKQELSDLRQINNAEKQAENTERRRKTLADQTSRTYTEIVRETQRANSTIGQAANRTGSANSQARGLLGTLRNIVSNIRNVRLPNINFSGVRNGLNNVRSNVNSTVNWIKNKFNEIRTLNPFQNMASGARSALDGLRSQISGIINGSRQIGGAFSEAGSMASRLGNEGVSAFSMLASVGRGALGGLKTMFEGVFGGGIKLIGGLAQGVIGLSRAIGQAVSKLRQFTQGLKQAVAQKLGIDSLHMSFNKVLMAMVRIAGYRAIRFFFSQLASAMREGINNLYQYSSLMGGTFKNSLDSVSTSFQYLKNSMAAAAAPLINSLAPAVNYLISRFVALLNVVNQFLSALGGKGVYTRAVRSYKAFGSAASSAGSAATGAGNSAARAANNAASSASKAAKSIKQSIEEVKDATTGIDELNIINQPKVDTSNPSSGTGGSGGYSPSGGGGGGGLSGVPDYGSMFETVPIDSKISDLANELKKKWEAGDWKGLGTMIGKKLNDVVKQVDWSGLGKKFGYYFNGVLQTLYYAVKAFDAHALGMDIAKFLNSALKQVNWNIVGRFTQIWKQKLFDLIIGVVHGLNWKLVGKAFGDYWRGVFDSWTEWFSKYNWNKMGKALYDHVHDAIVGINFGSLSKSFFSMLGQALGSGVSFLAGVGSKIGGALHHYFAPYVKKEGGDVVYGIIDGIVAGAAKLPGAINKYIVQPFKKHFESAVKGNLKPHAVLQGISFIAGFIGGMILRLPMLIGHFLADLAQVLGNAIADFADRNAKKYGVNIVEGLILGLAHGVVALVKGVWNYIIKPFIHGFLEGFGIASPSKVMRKYAKYIPEGILLGIKDGAEALVDLVKWLGNKIIDKFKEFFDKKKFKEFGERVKHIGEGIKSKAQEVIAKAKDLAQKASKAIDKDFFTSKLKAFGERAKAFGDGIKSKISHAVEQAHQMAYRSKYKISTDFVTSHLRQFGERAYAFGEGIRSKIGDGINAGRDLAVSSSNSISRDFVTSRLRSFGNRVIGFVQGIRSHIGSAGKAAADVARRALSAADRGISRSRFHSIGRRVSEGIASGIESGIGLISRAVNSIVSMVSSLFQYGFQIFSPSRLMKYKIGYQLPAGLAEGMEENTQPLDRATNNVVNHVMGTTSKQAVADVNISQSMLMKHHFDGVMTAQNDTYSSQQDSKNFVDNYKQAMKEFYDEYIKFNFENMVKDTNKQANKKEQVTVNVGGREIKQAIKRQNELDGWDFVH